MHTQLSSGTEQHVLWDSSAACSTHVMGTGMAGVRKQGRRLAERACEAVGIVVIQTSVLRDFPSWVNGFFIMNRNQFMRDGELGLGQCAEWRELLTCRG